MSPRVDKILSLDKDIVVKGEKIGSLTEAIERARWGQAELIAQELHDRREEGNGSHIQELSQELGWAQSQVHYFEKVWINWGDAYMSANNDEGAISFKAALKDIRTPKKEVTEPEEEKETPKDGNNKASSSVTTDEDDEEATGYGTEGDSCRQNEWVTLQVYLRGFLSRRANGTLQPVPSSDLLDELYNLVKEIEDVIREES